MTMKLSTAALLIMTLLLGACTSLPKNESTEGAEPPAGDESPIFALAPTPTEASNETASTPSSSLRSSPRPASAAHSIWNDPDFRRRLAESYLSETDVEPPLSKSERQDLFEAIDLIGNGKLPEAVDLLLELIEDSGNATFDCTLANVYIQQEKLDEARQACQAAVEKFPRFRRAWRLLGQIQANDQRWTEAVTSLSRVIELGGGDGFTYGALANAYFKLGRYVPAETAFRRANLMQPDRVQWMVGLAESLFQQQRYEAAIAMTETLIAEQRESPELWVAQGEAYALIGQPMRAAENFEMAARLGGANAKCLNNLAILYANNEIYDQSVKYFLRAMKKDPAAGPGTAIEGAGFLLGKGALVEAAELIDGIEASLADGPDDPRLQGADPLAAASPEDRKELLRLRARVAGLQDDVETQRLTLVEIVDLDPRDGTALIQLGLIARLAEKPEQAILYFERAASVPDFEGDAKKSIGQLLVSQDKYAEALPYLRDAYKIDPRPELLKFIEQVERAAANR